MIFLVLFQWNHLFRHYEETFDEWVKEQGDGILSDYDLVTINDHKSHSFYTVSSLEDFAKMLDTEWAREWDKANNCRDIVYKLELIEWQILAKRFLEHEVTFSCWCKATNGKCKRIERCLAFRCSVHWILKTEEKTNTIRTTVLALVKDTIGYKIELIERELWRN